VPVIVACDDLRQDVDGTETEISPTTVEPCHQSLYISSAASSNYGRLVEATILDDYLEEVCLRQTYRYRLKNTLPTIYEGVEWPNPEEIVAAEFRVLTDESDGVVPVTIAFGDLQQDVDGTETEISSSTSVEPCHQSLYISSAASSNYGCLMEATIREDYLDETYRSTPKNKLSTIEEVIQSPMSENIAEADSKILIDESNGAVPVIIPFEDLHQDGDAVEVDTVVMPKRRRSLWSRTKKLFRRYLCCCC